jgi:hypothetical protein
MRLIDILVGNRHVSREAAMQALERQHSEGGSATRHMVSEGTLDDRVARDVMADLPREPETLEELGLRQSLLLELLLKTIYVRKVETALDLAANLCINYSIVKTLLDEAIERKLLHIIGMSSAGMSEQLRYAMTPDGRDMVREAYHRNSYVGPAPIPMKEFAARARRQTIRSNRVTAEELREAMRSAVLPRGFVKKVGPAVNLGEAVLVYGPPGNGKTLLASQIGTVFKDCVLLPYALEIDSEIIKFYDPSIHQDVSISGEIGGGELDERESYGRLDQRWVACRRPLVISGGELTLEMLDLAYNEATGFYDAPLHMKAVNGVMLIDDFGRQLVSAKDLLNRWIMPLEKGVDYLKLHTGKSFEVPFDELVVFSTNLRPIDIMDAAFLRRVPYKIHIEAPTKEHFLSILEKEAEAAGLTFTEQQREGIYQAIMAMPYVALAAYQPRFIVNQILAQCKFLGIESEVNQDLIDAALENLTIEDEGEQSPSFQ